MKVLSTVFLNPALGTGLVTALGQQRSPSNLPAPNRAAWMPAAGWAVMNHYLADRIARTTHPPMTIDEMRWSTASTSRRWRNN